MDKSEMTTNEVVNLLLSKGNETPYQKFLDLDMKLKEVRNV